MQYNNRKVIILFFLLLISSFSANAQGIKDSLSVPDAIIRVDGGIIYGKVTEVNPTDIKYRIVNIQDGAIVTIPLEQVYAISYSNHTTQIISPGFGQINSSVEKADSTSQSEIADTTKNFGQNIGHGSFRVGMGFAKDYTNYKGIENFNKQPNAPSMFLAYMFQFNHFLKTGVSLGYSSFNYDHTFTSEYDGIATSQKIQESVATLGVFGRYDLLDKIMRPYITLGMNINFSRSTMDGDIYLINEGKHILTTSNLNGFKPGLVARIGLELMIGKRFGLFSDVGTGSNLVQVGIIFSFK